MQTAKSIHIRCILILFSLGLSTCTSNDNPLKPSLTDPITGTMRILPLAAGATWNYDLFLSKSSANGGTSSTSTKHLGSFELQVVDEQVYSGSTTFLVHARIRIDSVIYRKYEEYPYFDSLSVFPGEIDTTIKYEIVFSSDTLWYKVGENLEFWMANRYPDVKSQEDIGMADLRIFSCPFFSKYYDPGTGPFWKTNFEIMEEPRYAYKKRDPAQRPRYYLYFFQKTNSIGGTGELRADLIQPVTHRTDTPGFINVKWFNHWGAEQTYSDETVNFTLISFTPGSQI